MRIHFFIPGNQENPKTGNSIPYHRTTQRGKWDKAARRYAAWKKYVQGLAVEAGWKFKGEKNGTYCLNVVCVFNGEKHGDPENVRKGIQDALFEGIGDKHVWGQVTFWHATPPFYSGAHVVVEANDPEHR